MYIPSNIIKLPNIVLFPDLASSGGANTVATFNSASSDANYRFFDLEQNTNYSLSGVDKSIITVTKKTLVRATLRQSDVITNQSYLYGIFDSTSNLQLGCQGGYGLLLNSFASPHGGTLAQYHNSADAIVDANTSFYLKIISVSPSGGGIYPEASKIYLFQLEP